MGLSWRVPAQKGPKINTRPEQGASEKLNVNLGIQSQLGMRLQLFRAARSWPGPLPARAANGAESICFRLANGAHRKRDK